MVSTIVKPIAGMHCYYKRRVKIAILSSLFL